MSPLKKAFVSSLPVLFGYVPLGIAYGFLLSQSGIPWYFAGLTSIIVFAGAAQFLALGLWSNLAPLPEIAAATLLLNLRHAFFGLSLLKKFSNTGKAKAYLIFALTDENYALLSSQEEMEEGQKKRYYLTLSLLNHFYWSAGSVLGALLGAVLKINLVGLDFALTALFIVLALEQYKKIKKLKPFVIAIISGVFAFLLPFKQILLLLAISTGTILLLLTRRNEE